MKNGKNVNVKVEQSYDRLRIRINGIIHLSFPYNGKESKIIVQSYFTGNEKYYTIEYNIDGQIIETGYTRKDIFIAILKELEDNNII